MKTLVLLSAVLGIVALITSAVFEKDRHEQRQLAILACVTYLVASNTLRDLDESERK